jgi:hypothetical protein
MMEASDQAGRNMPRRNTAIFQPIQAQQHRESNRFTDLINEEHRAMHLAAQLPEMVSSHV